VERQRPPRRGGWFLIGNIAYLIVRLLVLVLAMIVVGTIVGAVVGAFRGGIAHAAYNGGFFGFVVGAWIFGLGFLAALVRAARGGFRKNRT
jgi:hypothetical protein